MSSLISRCDDAIDRMHAHVNVTQEILDIKKVGTDQMFCTGQAGAKKTDVCKGDSGGPLVRKVSEKYIFEDVTNKKLQ